MAILLIFGALMLAAVICIWMFGVEEEGDGDVDQ